jgi:putative nucleotidyltransferase with HDIG domain
VAEVADPVQMEELRAGVRKSLPELDLISDSELREKVVEAWALALSKTSFRSIDALPPEGDPGDWILQRGTQGSHLRCVARMALAIANEIETVFGPIKVNRDYVVAAGLLHDVGKAFEMDPANQERWRGDPAASGYPAVRHPGYGIYIAMTVGLPEAIVNCVGYHSLPAEGQYVKAGLTNMLVQHADNSVWRILERAGLCTRPNPT